ncbi:HlyD family efflux transporter periplasmic adaptor subunit [Opacimonas viscosa]|uniref:HlyD family efflux transporter periplasmic adaptor subunit n=1 Tax=Opacimonas viscosa TaxID=2961944 RepID=A0AA41X710_9ALTE|nr:HlyD family efflux transporter periplasmic adaptor subunit [Opacimonas viscosa]MCP3429749.1 HlyD family efflux transporter periplasmic adaptor subunit [Opacimonas viscosa]
MIYTQTKERRGMIYMLLLGLIAFGVWATWFELDQTVRAPGQLVTETRTQIVQAADGGVIKKIYVAEGDPVRQGDVIATLEDERAKAGVEEGRAKVAALSAALTRARAQAQDTPLSFTPDELVYPHIVKEQQALFKQAALGLEAELTTGKTALGIAQEELSINESLFATGDASRLDVMRSRRQVVELEGKLTTINNEFKQRAREEVTQLQQQFISEQYQLLERESILKHTELKAPLDGVIKSLRIDTIGGVLRAGDELLQISPADTELFVEVKINPADIGSLEIGMPASVKIDAFDYTIYGGLNGELTYLSSDTLSQEAADGQNSVFYKALVKIDKQSSNPKLLLSDLKAGMTAGVDIQTGSRTVLEYIMKPVTRAFQGAGSER